MCSLTDAIKESLRMRDREGQPLKKVVKGKSWYNRRRQVEWPRPGAGQQESSPFPLDHARKRSDTKTKGKGWEPSLEFLGHWGVGVVSECTAVDGCRCAGHFRNTTASDEAKLQ